MLNASVLDILNNRASKLGQILRTVSVSRAKPIVFALANVTLETAVGTKIRMPGMHANAGYEHSHAPYGRWSNVPACLSVGFHATTAPTFLARIRPAAQYWRP